jgi:5-methylcytosine-specific restriction endonuclease McrA
MEVAVLNYDYTLNNITNWKRALILIEKGKAEVVKYSETIIRTTKNVVKVPQIVRLVYMIKNVYKRNIKMSKRNLFLRDGNRCGYCGKYSDKTKINTRLTIDHIFPKSRGGKTTWLNCVSACVDCNNKKGNKTLEEAKMVLLFEVYEPTIYSFQKAKMKETLKNILENI